MSFARNWLWCAGHDAPCIATSPDHEDSRMEYMQTGWACFWNGTEMIGRETGDCARTWTPRHLSLKAPEGV